MIELKIQSFSMNRLEGICHVDVQLLKLDGPFKEVTRQLNIRLDEHFEGINDPNLLPAVSKILNDAGIVAANELNV